MYYILDYFGILFILDINSVLRGTKVLLNYIFSVLNFVMIFLLKKLENIYSLLLVSLLILSCYAWLVTEIGARCPGYKIKKRKKVSVLKKINKFQLYKKYINFIVCIKTN